METRKIPEITPVANTDLVSRYTQKVTANQTVKFMTETTRVLSSRWRKVRCVPVRRSSAGVVVVMVTPWRWVPGSRSCKLKPTRGQELWTSLFVRTTRPTHGTHRCARGASSDPG